MVRLRNETTARLCGDMQVGEPRSIKARPSLRVRLVRSMIKKDMRSDYCERQGDCTEPGALLYVEVKLKEKGRWMM